MKFDNIDAKQKTLEYIILLVLGTSLKNKESILHLQKEVFLIWNFHPGIKEFFNFIKHYKGPFSREISETVRDPMFLYDSWLYLPPEDKDKLSGGYIEITDLGKEHYQKLVNIMEQQDNEEILHLLTGIKMVTELYDKLNLEELLLLIYETYPKFTTKSNVYYQINNKRKKLAHQLFKKGYIDKEKCLSLEGDNK